MWELIGTLGIIAIEASYVPQIVRLWTTKKADDLSVFFPLLNLTGRIFVTLYAWHLGSFVMGLGFLTGIVVRATFLSLVLGYKPRRKESSVIQPSRAETKGVPTWPSSQLQH